MKTVIAVVASVAFGVSPAAACEPNGPYAATVKVVGGQNKLMVTAGSNDGLLVSICHASSTGPANLAATAIKSRPDYPIAVSDCITLTTESVLYLYNSAGGTVANVKYCVEGMRQFKK